MTLKRTEMKKFASLSLSISFTGNGSRQYLMPGDDWWLNTRSVWKAPESINFYGIRQYRFRVYLPESMHTPLAFKEKPYWKYDISGSMIMKRQWV